MSQDLVCEKPDQREQLAIIGAHLQDVRKQQGLSLEQIAAKTLVQARLLRAIEGADLGTLPEPIYIRGFIKRYADSLGLNGSEIAASFPIEVEVQPVQTSSWNNSAAAQLRPLHLYAAYVALIVAAVSGVSYLLSVLTPTTLTTLQQSPPASQSSDNGAAVDSAPPQTAASSGESSDATATASAADELAPSGGRQAGSPVQISLELVERSWLRVTVDGNEEFEGVLQEGSEQTWTADSEVTVRAGNAGGVLLAINNSPAEIMGEPGSVLERTFSIDSPAEAGASASQ